MEEVLLNEAVFVERGRERELGRGRESERERERNTVSLPSVTQRYLYRTRTTGSR